MPAQPKILLLDDDPDFLSLYKEMLGQHLPTSPEIKVASSGARALALLESEQFSLLILDLNLPKMDGLQVITIVRRKYPQLRIVVLTAIRDEQFRTRAYGMGVDQYWIKPESDQEVGLFMESIDSIINHELHEGFRGVQSKSLVDIIQLECLSQSSCTLRITNGLAEGKIHIHNGEVIDAEVPGLNAEPAFQRILSWKHGSFETLPSDPTRARTIFTSYQGLLLNTAQAIDEAASQDENDGEFQADHGHRNNGATVPSMTFEMSQVTGVEFVLEIASEGNSLRNSWGLDNPESVAEFTQQTVNSFKALGERLQAGELQHVLGSGTQRNVAMTKCGEVDICVGFSPSVGLEHIRESVKTLIAKWAS